MRNVATAKSINNSKRREDILKEFGISHTDEKRVIKLSGVDFFEEIQNEVHSLKDKNGNSLLVRYEPGLVIINNECVYAKKKKNLYCFFVRDGKVFQRKTKIRGNIKFTEKCVFFMSNGNKIINALRHGLKPICFNK